MHIGIVAPCSTGELADLLPSAGGADVGWGGYLIATLVRALVVRGHRVSVITLSDEVKERTVFYGQQLIFYVYPTRLYKRMRDLFRFEREGIKDGISRARPDILHAHWTYEFALACLETNRPTLITTHDNAFQILRYTTDMFRLGCLYMQIHVLRRARFLTAVSPYLANSLRWLARTEIEVVPNPVDVPPRGDHNDHRAQDGARIVTALQGWGGRKNPEVAIEAFQLLRREMPEAEMFMYGEDFEANGTAAQWAARRGLNGNIRFCGFQPHADMLKRFRDMSVLLHPALEESCGMVLLEAMAQGLPVVAGMDAGGVPWVLDEGRAGYLTDVRQPDKIAATLLTCLQQAEERKQKQSNAYERVSSVFSPDAVAEQYERLYAKVLGA